MKIARNSRVKIDFKNIRKYTANYKMIKLFFYLSSYQPKVFRMANLCIWHFYIMTKIEASRLLILSLENDK